MFDFKTTFSCIAAVSGPAGEAAAARNRAVHDFSLGFGSVSAERLPKWGVRTAARSEVVGSRVCFERQRSRKRLAPPKMEEVADVPYEGVVGWLLCRRLLPEDYHQRLKGEKFGVC